MARRRNGEGSFYRRADGVWVGRILIGGKRRAEAAKTQAEARRKLEALRRAADQGPPLDTRRQTVAQYLADWLAATGPTLKPRTAQGYADLVRLHIAPTLGHHPLSSLGPQHVEAWRNGLLARGLSPRSALHAYAVLRVALNRATKLQLMPRNPVLLVDPPRVTTTEIHPLGPAQAGQLLTAARGERYEHLYALLLATGLRLGEAQALRWQDVDLAAGCLQVRHTLEVLRGHPWRLAEPKSQRGRRVVPLIGPAAAALRAQQERQALERQTVGSEWQDHQFVFTNPLGAPVTASTVDKDFKRLLELAGLPTSHRVHDLRHSTATYLLGASVPERVVMDILGHSNLAMTHHYQHVLSGMLVDAAARLEGWLANPRSRQRAACASRMTVGCAGCRGSATSRWCCAVDLPARP